jgi:uncharacterized protein
MDEMFHEGNRELQERFDTRRLADRIENLLVHETFTGRDKAFVMYLSMGNLLKNPHVGILFIDFEGRDRMRVNGEASVNFDDELRSWWPEAQFVVRVRAREIFPNCPRYVHRYQKVQASAFVPRENCETPVPSWKRADWAVDVLPEGDPALDPDATVV